MTKRGFHLLFISLLAIVLLAACGTSGSQGNDGGTTPTPTPTPTPPPSETVQPPAPTTPEPPKEPEKPKDPVDLVIYHYNGSWTEEQNQAVFADPITKKYPHIKMKALGYTGAKQLEDMVVTGTTPDLIMTTPGPGFETTVLKYNAQTDLTPLIKQFNYDLNQLDPSGIGVVRSLAPTGELYSLPIYMAPFTLYYNEAIFDKFGVDYPSDNMTWDDMYSLSRTLTRQEDGVQYYGFMLSYVHLMRLNQVSQNLFDASGTKVAFDTDVYKNYLKDIFRIFQLPGYDLTGSLAWNPKFVQDKTLAMLEAGGTLLAEDLLAGLENRWNFAAFPSTNDKPGVGFQPYPFIISMFNTSKHKEEAFEAMAYLTSEEFQAASTKQGTLLPVLNDKSIVSSFGQESAFYQGKNVGALLPKQFAPVPDEPFSKYTAIAHNNMYTIFTKVLREGKDINTATREAAEQANNQIAEAIASDK